ncbi:MAG: SDR family NAD(P)-dependent oxidoreductase, partial [Pseudomonadota bacterium]
MNFNDKTVIITGGGSGIGLTTAELFARQGANLVINGRNADKLTAAATRIDPTGARVLTVAGDIAQPATAERIVSEAVARFGG